TADRTNSATSGYCFALPAYSVLPYALPLLRFQHLRWHHAAERALCSRPAHGNHAGRHNGAASRWAAAPLAHHLFWWRYPQPAERFAGLTFAQCLLQLLLG